MEAENSRSCPGNEKVKVGKHNWSPKYLLTLPKKEVIEKFLKITDEDGNSCPFKMKTLLRKWPRNVVVPTIRDSTSCLFRIYGLLCFSHFNKLESYNLRHS